MNKKMYSVYNSYSFLSNEIKELDVIRETEHTIWMENYSERKNTSSTKHFEKWEDAHAYLLDKTTSKRDSLRRNLADAEHDLTTVLNMKPPL